MLIDVQGLTAAHPTKPLFADLNFTIDRGDRVGVVGVNGSGKSTLLQMVTGELAPHGGVIRRRRDLRLTSLGQRLPDQDLTVREVVGQSWEADAALDRLGLATVAARTIGSLSGGQARRVGLAAVLVEGDAELLVLDEPTNHLDLDGIEFLERTLEGFGGGVLFVTHDRRFLERLATRIVGISRAGSMVVDGGYEEFVAASAAAEEQAERAEASRRILARQELAWLRRGARARRRKPKARLAVAQQTLTQPVHDGHRAGDLTLDEFGSKRLGRQVVELVGVAAGHDDGVTLFSDVHLLLDARSRLGIIGPNGAGKSTFLDVLAGRRAPLEGTVAHGATVTVGYFDQGGRALDPTITIEELLMGPGNRLDPAAKSLLERFWFEPATHRARVGTLSGGEQRRLQLLAVLMERPNVLLLDEPTNDLDLDTLRALEDWLEGFPGALVAVTHDRAFLERTAEHVLAIRDGRVVPVAGGDAVWEAARTPAPRPDPGSLQPRQNGQNPDGRDRTRRSASTLRHLMARTEEEMERVRRERDDVAVLLGAAQDHEEIAALGRRLAAAEEAVVDAEERWLALAEEAEAGS